MSPEQLDREVKALGAPLMTGLAYGDDADFEAEVEKRATLLANEKTAELRRERHQLREALKRAEERLQPPTPAKATKPTTEAPSAPDKPQEDAGAVVADLLAARERLWPDGPPRGPFSRS
jgi:hypothetical protein